MCYTINADDLDECRACRGLLTSEERYADQADSMTTAQLRVAMVNGTD